MKKRGGTDEVLQAAAGIQLQNRLGQQVHNQRIISPEVADAGAVAAGNASHLAVHEADGDGGFRTGFARWK